MDKFIIPVLFIMALISHNQIFSQNYIIDLYPKGEIPNYRPSGEAEIIDTSDIVRISKVQTPDIAVFLPSKRNSTGEAVVIFPGGGYGILAYDWEGIDIARYWNSKGIAAIVLKYRLPSSESQVIPWESPLTDARRAVRMVRYYSKDWNIHPDKIGVMGFSAGGHLAATLSTQYDTGKAGSVDPIEQQSCRPDFSILIYPVISFISKHKHEGSLKNLLGEDPDPELLEFFSPEMQVTKDTPPAILIHSADDKGVPVENSILYFKSLLSKGVSAEMHIYPFGGHGYSLAIGKGQLANWPDRCYEWLKGL